MFTIKAWLWKSDVLNDEGKPCSERMVFEASDYRVFHNGPVDGTTTIIVRANVPSGVISFPVNDHDYHQVIVENSKGQTTDRFRWVIPAEEGLIPYAAGF